MNITQQHVRQEVSLIQPWSTESEYVLQQELLINPFAHENLKRTGLGKQCQYLLLLLLAETSLGKACVYQRCMHRSQVR